ncbi:glutathione peroxidase [bacterium]|nr:glutathione peroxidase [bacterium]
MAARASIPLASTRAVHADHHALWIDPTNPRYLVNGNDGGIYVSRDGGDNWLFTTGLPLSQFYHVRHDNDAPYNVYGGLQDNGSWRGPSSVWEGGGIRNQHWNEVNFGLGRKGWSVAVGGRDLALSHVGVVFESTKSTHYEADKEALRKKIQGAYEELEKLHEQYSDKVEVLGFPANNFLWQEPGDNDEIATFCEKNYGVKFQMFEKISVKGKDKHPLYRWLEAKSGKSPSWNFCKYLISPDGKFVSYYPAKVSPLDRDIISQLQPK